MFGSLRYAVCLLGLLTVSTSARAAVLATVQKSFSDHSGLPQPVDPSLGFKFMFAVFPPPFPSPIPNQLFDGYTWSATDLGRVVTVTAADDPDFAKVAALLTNSQADDVELLHTYFTSPPTIIVNAGNGLSEPSFLGRTQLDPDFAGFSITAISERLDSLSVTNTPPAPGQTLYDVNVSGTLTYTIEGVPTPEPGAALTICCLGALISWRRRRY